MENFNSLSEVIQYKKEHGRENIYYKQIVKKRLINNPLILEALDAPDLDPEEDADAYVGKYIVPYYVLPEVKTQAQNIICFETSFTELPRYNQTEKYQQIIFYILADPKNIYDRKTGIARHDLIAALIQDQFDWSNYFGFQIHLVQDRPYAVDSNKYVLRTLKFEQVTPNGYSNMGNIINKVRSLDRAAD